MIENTNLVPKRRFKEFQNAATWEQRKFEEYIISIQTGTNLLGAEVNNGTPLLKMGNIQRGYFSFKKLEYLDENKQVEEENIAHYGDFLFNTRNTLELVGKGATWTGESGKYAFNSNIARFVFRGIDTIFFNYLYNTQSMINQVHARAVGTTSVAAVYPRDLNSLKCMLPSLEEQKKIGKFLLQLDHLITLHQRKFEKMKSLKSAYLSEMFPAEGEREPKRRFAGFTNAWEQRELSELVETIGTGRSSFDSDIQESPEKPYVVLGSTSVISYDSEYDHIGDFILTARVGANAGNLYKHSGKVKISDNTVYIQSRNLNFIYYLLTKFDLKRLSFGTGQPLLKASELKKLKLMIPKILEERQKIGEFFASLDHLITLHQRKLEKLHNIKKAYLNEMFI